MFTSLSNIFTAEFNSAVPRKANYNALYVQVI